jgi:capsular polysaccharide biosynthesis protein
MDPMEVIRTMWRHKVFVLPVLLLTFVAAGYVYQFGPRYYEAGTSFAIVNPRLPSDRELELDPGLANLNGDNPFLRSSDHALVSEVLIARLTSSAVSDGLEAKGLSTDYTVSKGINGNGFVVSITASGGSEDLAIKTAAALGDELQRNLRDIQRVNNADDRFLFTALTVTPLGEATEQFSSRLRSVIMVVLGGAILMFGAVSTARSMAAMGQNWRRNKSQTGSGGGAKTISHEDKGSDDEDERQGVVATAKPGGAVAALPMARQPIGPQPRTRRSSRVFLRTQAEDVNRTGEHVVR